MYELINKIVAFIHNATTPTVLTEYVIKNNLGYSGMSKDGEWLYYWEGDFKTGHEVKVSVEEQRKYLKERKCR